MNSGEHHLTSTLGKGKRIHPPGPKNPWLGFGHVRPLMQNLVGYTTELAEAHGDLVCFRVGPQWVYQVTHPDYAQEVLSHQASFFEKPRFIQSVFRPWVDQGVLFSEGAAWKRQRRLVESAVRSVPVEQQTQSVVGATGEMVLAHAGEEVDMADLVERLSFFTLLEVIFQDVPRGEAEQAYQDSTTLQLDAIYRTGSLTIPPRWAPTGYNQRYRAALKRFHTFMEKQFARRRNEPACDLAGGLLAARDENDQPYNKEEVYHGATNFLFGGKETGAAALIWPLYTLARYPEAQQRAEQEVATVLDGSPPAAEHVERLKYVERHIKESFRLYPPVPMLTRQPIRPVEIGGYFIRSRGYMFLSPIHIHRDRRWFDEPLAFRPERFLPENERSLRPFSYLPFGGGPHVCIGRSFAQLEVALAIATILAEHRLTLPDDHGEPKLKIDERLHPDGPLKMRLERK